MASIFTPSNQVKLTNVSVVRLRRAGKRFEIACYPNKVLEWRSGVTRSLDEVLQSPHIFTNVSKGQTARTSDLREAFGSDQKTDQIILQILGKGDLQVTAKERSAQQEMLLREVATLVAQQCVNPHTKLPYPASLIEQAMKEHLHWSPPPPDMINQRADKKGLDVESKDPKPHPKNLQKTNNSAKQYALEVIQRLTQDANLQQVFPIRRAFMRVRLECPEADRPRLLEAIRGWAMDLSKDDYTFEFSIDPGSYRPLCETVAQVTRGKGVVRILSLRDHHQSSEEDE